MKHPAHRLAMASRHRAGTVVACDGFAGMAEFMIRCRRHRCAEVPMQIRFAARKGISHIRILRTIREHLGVIGRNLRRRRACPGGADDRG